MGECARTAARAFPANPSIQLSKILRVSPSVFRRLFYRRRITGSGLLCGQPCAPRLNVQKKFCVALPRGSGAISQPSKQIDGLHVLRRRVLRAIGAARASSRADAGLFHNRVRPGAALFRRIFRAKAVAISRRRGGPWTNRWQWLVGVIALRVCPRGCDEIPRARTLRPGLREICPSARLHAPFQLFLFQA